MQFGVAATIAHWQPYPTERVAFSEEGVLLTYKETRYPRAGVGLHPLHGLLKCLLDRRIENSCIFKRHVQRFVSHQLLERRLANAVVQQRDGKGMAESMRCQATETELDAQLADEVTHLVSGPGPPVRAKQIATC